MLNLLNIQTVNEILARDNVIYREVFKIFISEHPELFETVHKNIA